MAVSQSDVLRMYTALAFQQKRWAGCMMLCVGLESAGAVLAYASLVAGAATLLLEQDTKLIRDAARAGAITFEVTTLDEALRILKNQVRQGRAITVALSGEPTHWLREMVERGVQPGFVTASRLLSADEGVAMRVLLRRGALALHGFDLCPIDDRSEEISSSLQSRMHSVRVAEDVAPSLAERAARDRLHADRAASLGPLEEVEAHWLRVAPQLFPRALDRAYWQAFETGQT